MMKKKGITYPTVLVSTALLLFFIIFSSGVLIAAAESTSSTIYAYATTPYDDTVAVINTATNTIDAKINVGVDPYGVAVNPSGTKVYVTNKASNTVSIIDATTRTVISTVNVGITPYGVAVNPAGTKVYVTNEASNTVSVIDTTTNTVTATVNVGDHPYGVAVNPTGTKVYVTNLDNSGSVDIIDTATNNVTANVSSIGPSPHGIAVNPDGTEVYVADSGSNNVSVIDTATNTITATMNVGEGHRGITFTPDGTKVFVTNFVNNDSAGNTVSVIDTETNTVTATVNVGDWPEGIAVTPDGKKVYVAVIGGMSVIDTSTNAVTATVDVSGSASAFGQFIGSIPVQNSALPIADFSTSVTSGYYPLSVHFTDLSQNAISRSWDVNGDGIEDSSEASFDFEYVFAGTYTAKLTAINANGTATKTVTIDVDRKSSGGSGGGGGGGGGSPEPAKNVEVKEISQVFITNGKAVKFDFTRNATCVVYVGFNAIKNAGKITTIAEQLKNKSALVPKLPEGDVYKSFNVWVGNSGYATSKNIEKSVLCFKVEKSWLQNESIDQDSITLNRYEDENEHDGKDGTWTQLPASLTGEDDKYLYFTAKVPSYGSFTITGTAITQMIPPVTSSVDENKSTNENGNSTKHPDIPDDKIMVWIKFIAILVVVACIIVVILKKINSI